MSKSNLICGAKNILDIPMSLMLHNYFFLTVKDKPNPINVVCCIIGILIHHKKVLAEERYLIDKVGNAYRDYMRQAWRYL